MLKQTEHVAYVKRKESIVVTKQQKKIKLDWTKDELSWNISDWKIVLFSGKKKSNLDDPDGLQHHSHDLQKKAQLFSMRVGGKRVVWVWGFISYKGTSI